MKFFSTRILPPILLSGIVLTAFALQNRSPEKRASNAGSPFSIEPVSKQIDSDLFIRVNLTVKPVKKIHCRINQPFEVVSFGNNRVLASFSKPVKTEISITQKGIRINGRAFSGSQFEIVPQKSPSIEVAGTLYRGRIRLLRVVGSRLIVVNVLPLEDYLASVINGEMPSAFPAEARKAQIIAARTYAIYQMSNASDSSRYDLFASSLSQKYLGFRYTSKDGKLLAGETKIGRNLARKTAGLICTINGRMFCPYYSAVCGGETVAGKHVFKDGGPLLSVKCPWCKPAKKHRWQSVISFDDFSRAFMKSFPKLKNRFSRIASVTSIGKSQNPDHLTIEIKNGRYKKRVSPMQFRKMFPVKIFSMRFSIVNGKKGIRVTGMGHGHGVGMCQWGARGMALEGANYERILKHYYPGSEITSLEKIAN